MSELLVARTDTPLPASGSRCQADAALADWLVDIDPCLTA